MFGATLSTAVRNSLVSLQHTASELNKTQARLATGLRVAAVLDAPVEFATARSLNARAGELDRLLDSVGLAERTLEAASAGIRAIGGLVEAARSIASQALATRTTTAVVTGTTSLTGGQTLATLGFADGDTVEISTSAGTTTFTVADAAAETVDDLVAALDANPNAAVTMSGGAIRIEATDGGDLTVGDGATGTNLDALGLSAGTTSASINPTRHALAAAFDQLLGQIDDLVADAGFNGVNLLAGQSLPVAFDETGTSALVVGGTRVDAAGLGIGRATNGFQDDASVEAALAELTGARSRLRSLASTFGANLSVVGTRQSFAKSMIHSLQGAAADLTIADTNAEGARLLALDTRRQLSTAALTIATSSDRAVLGLL